MKQGKRNMSTPKNVPGKQGVNTCVYEETLLPKGYGTAAWHPEPKREVFLIDGEE